MSTPNFGQPGFYKSNSDQTPNPGGFSPSERVVYADAYECLDRPLDIANLRQLFLLMTQAHWSSPLNYGANGAGLECLVYDRSEAPELEVRLAHDFKAEVAWKKPSIFVQVDRMQFTQTVIDNQTGRSPDLSTVERYWKVKSMLVVSHYHPSADIAARMADNTMFFFLGIGESLMQRLNLQSFVPQEIGSLQKIDSSPDPCFRVDSSILLTYTFNITTAIEGHRLKQFSLEIEGANK